MGSGYPYPLPFKLIAANTYLVLKVALTFASGKAPPEDPGSDKDLEKRNPFPLGNAFTKDTVQLTPSFPEMDFPCQSFDNVVCCGPILRKREPLTTSDPKLESWLTKPTILISLGSHMKPTEQIAIQMAKAIKLVLDRHPDKQVLWKLRYEWEESKEFREVLDSAIASGQVWITPWIQADIMSVLETGRIAAYVHHGGANSYFEACK